MINHVITQGERYVSEDPKVQVSTLLGSCVACCLWDPVARVGGMNHMLIPPGAAGGLFASVNDMELLINDLLKIGAIRSRLQAKLFGGAQMVTGLSEIGQANSRFALQFLETENIGLVAKSLGGESARQILFHPATGHVRQRVTRQTPEEGLPRPADTQATANGLELF